jgi:hypothetical protein
MIQRSSSSKLKDKLREKQFRLDCTNKQESQYPEYNILKDKYLKYVMPCPCIFYVRSKCHQNLTFHGRTSPDERLTDLSRQPSKHGSIRVGRSQPKLGKILRNIKTTE